MEQLAFVKVKINAFIKSLMADLRQASLFAA